MPSPSFRLFAAPAATASPLLFELPIHSNFVGGLVALSDGRTVVTSSEDGRICLVDVEKREVLRDLMGHSSAVNHLALSPDGKLLASASDDFTVRLWDTESWETLAVCSGHTNYVSRVAVTPSGLVVSASKDNTCRVWDREGKERARYTGHTEWVLALGLIPGLPEAVTVSQDGAIKRWNIDLGEEIPTPFDEAEARPVIHIPGFDLVLGRGNRSGIGHENHAADLAFTADGRWMVSVEKAILIHDMESGAQRARHGGFAWPIKRMAFSHDGERIFTASDSVRAWSFDDGRELALFPSSQDEFTSLALGPGERRLYAGSKKGHLVAWDVGAAFASGPARSHTSRVNQLVYSPSGARVASAAHDGRVGLWDAASGSLIRMLAHGSPFVKVIEFTADGKQLVTGADNEWSLWDAATGECLRAVREGVSSLNAGALTSDGQGFITGSVGEDLLWWDLRSETPPASFTGKIEHTTQLILSPDQTRVLTRCYSRDWETQTDPPAPLQLWDVPGKKLLRAFLPPEGESFSDVIFLPGGRAVAATDKGLLQLLDLESGGKLREWKAHPGWISALTALPEGQIGTAARELPAGVHTDPAPFVCRVWDAESGRELSSQSLAGTTLVDSFTWIDEGQALLLLEQEPVSWNLTTGAVEARLHLDHPLTSLAVSPDRRQVALGDEKGTVRLAEWA